MAFLVAVVFALALAWSPAGVTESNGLSKPARWALPESDSPDKKYRLILVEEKEVLNYALISAQTGQILYRFPCSYHVEEDDADWAIGHAKEAEIYWNKDSNRFALDEDNYRFVGKVFLCIITLGDGPGSITTTAFEPANLGLWGPFEKSRIRVDKGWLDPWTLSLEITWIDSAPPEAPHPARTQKFNCDASTHDFRMTKVPSAGRQ